MKIKLVIAFVLFLNTISFSQEKRDSVSVSDSTSYLRIYRTEENIKYFRALPWYFSPYVSLGIGSANFFKAEIGQNIGAHLAFGLNFIGNDNWSNRSSDIKPGYFICLKIPHYKLDKYVPYITYSAGASMAPMNKRDTYTQLVGGVMYQIAPPLNLKVELGGIVTQRYISGGNELYGGIRTAVYEVNAMPTLNISIEINFLGSNREN